MSHSDSIQDYYDNKYHDSRRETQLLAHYSLKDRLAFFQEECVPDNSRVLDYGCGPGTVLTGLKNIDIDKSFGVDISETSISHARQLFPKYHWKRITADSPLPFPDGSFDVVIHPKSLSTSSTSTDISQRFTECSDPAARMG